MTAESFTSTAEPEEASADESAEAEASDAYQAGEEPTRVGTSAPRLALLIGLTIAVAMAALCGWLGYRLYEQQLAAEQRALFLQVGRQGAINLTTIDWQHADADVQRILSSATGPFYDDFSKRSQPFIEVVTQAKSKTEGSISEAGLESESDTDASVLVAVSVKTSNNGAPEQKPRAWRMRILVQKVGDDVKVSNVEFVP